MFPHQKKGKQSLRHLALGRLVHGHRNCHHSHRLIRSWNRSYDVVNGSREGNDGGVKPGASEEVADVGAGKAFGGWGEELGAERGGAVKLDVRDVKPEHGAASEGGGSGEGGRGAIIPQGQ